MLGLLSRWRKPTLLLTTLDTPSAGKQILLPQLDVRGWLAFDKPFDLDELSVTLSDGDRELPLVFEQRPEVERPARLFCGWIQPFV